MNREQILPATGRFPRSGSETMDYNLSVLGFFD